MMYFSQSFPTKYSFVKIIVISLTLTLMISCASVGKYTPKPSLAQGVAGVLNISHSVDVISTQLDSTERDLKFKNIIVNYYRFSQSLANALKMELKNNGVLLSRNPQKKLFIRVSKVEIPKPDINFRAFIEVYVKTGEGQEIFFKTTRASYASPFNKNTFPTKPLDAAFRDMVKKILMNKKIIDYLK